mgnify:CR=1 FL=1
MEIWKHCWNCKHETPQKRSFFKMFPRPIEGFVKDSDTDIATSIWSISIDAYQFCECKKCEAPLLHIDTYQLKNNANNFHEYTFTYLILLYIRVKNNKKIQKVENESFLYNTGEYHIIAEELEKLETKIKIKFSKEERLLLCDYILGFLSYSYNTSIFEYWIKTEVIIKNLINKVNTHTQINISSDEELLSSLLSHIKPTIYRLKNNFSINSDIHIKAVEEHFNIFYLVKKSLSKFNSIICKEISDSEIALLTLHFLA